jgi:DNA-binding response OmpR family regulator
MTRILWADDEIELLKPHVMFLENKGYHVTTVQSGNDAIDVVKEENFDIVFLDENMPGLTGLETLDYIKKEKPSVPIVMITKSEEESIMDSAIGGRINDYLIKPVNPNQILLSIKKNLEGKRLVNEKTTSSYQQKFREISMDLQDNLDYDGWAEIYKRLVYWEVQFENTDQSMMEVLQMQKNEANQLFSKYVANNYTDWFNNEGPLMSHELLKNKVFPTINNDPTFFNCY